VGSVHQMILEVMCYLCRRKGTSSKTCQ